MKYVVSKHIYKDIKNIKKMTGYSNFYRIKVGEYRLGIEINDDTIYVRRFLHRRDI